MYFERDQHQFDKNLAKTYKYTEKMCRSKVYLGMA